MKGPLKQLVLYRKRSIHTAFTLIPIADYIMCSFASKQIRECAWAPYNIVCMYLLIGKGQSAQKDHIGAKIENTEMEKIEK